MAPAPVFLSHPSSLEHDTLGHPEAPARITAIESELAARGWLGYERVQSPPVARDVLELVHAPGYIDSIERIALHGGGYLDADTVMSAGSFQAALRAAGGAVEMVSRLLAADEPGIGFSAHRPPGHHALADRAMGFCLFNSVAVAGAFATRRHGLERVLILDWDVHHGNGTSDAFLGSSEVLFVSIHQSPLYPGTGPASELGTGPGRGFTVNLPVPPGSGDEVYLSLLRHVVEPVARVWKPELVLVSAGFDAHHADPLASCEVTEHGFARMAAIVRDLAGSLGISVGCVLEGGYNIAALARSVAATMEALVNPGLAPAPEVALVPLARAAVERLVPLWPGLS